MLRMLGNSVGMSPPWAGGGRRAQRAGGDSEQLAGSVKQGTTWEFGMKNIMQGGSG